VPDLDTSLLAGSGHGYMILGTYGATTRDAAVKAYDVLRHTSQRDFAPGGSSDEPNDICIGPEKVPASWSGNQGRHDGYIAVRELEVDAGDSATLGGTATFRQNFTEADIAADTGEAKHSTTTAATGSFFAGGDVVAEGLYLRKSGDKAGYDVTNLVTADNDDGGVVGFWFCPDKSLFSGSHTLVRIHGATTSELLDLVVENGRIRVRIEANRAQVYWHHIAFAWFECVDDAGSDNNPTYDDDSNAETDWRDDEVAPPGTDRLLDPAPQVYAVVRVWIDGQSGFDSTASAINAFNLTPAGAGKPALQLGIASSPACGVFDSVAARPLAETEKSLTGINGISVDPRNRYMGNDSGSATYYSFERTIDLPHPIARVGAVCLGTIALDACYPRKYIDKDDAYPPVKATVELLDKDDATVGGTAQTAPFDEPTGARCTLGQGYVLRDSSWDTIHHTDAAKIRYTLKLTAYQGETAAGQFPQRCWESPVVNAVTITYLGPVVFYRWR